MQPVASFTWTCLERESASRTRKTAKDADSTAAAIVTHSTISRFPARALPGIRSTQLRHVNSAEVDGGLALTSST